MQPTYLPPKKALNKAFLKVKPNRSDIEHFKANLIRLLDRTNNTESEEFHKTLVSDFLKETWYKPSHFINTKGWNDLVIHNGPNADSPVGVIVETKKPTNKSEMPRALANTDKNHPESGQMDSAEQLNTKAFHELMLYYLRERITHKNPEVKHLIITNIYEWFIFDAVVFDRLFAQNKNLVRQFNDFEGGRLADTTTDFFYKQIAAPFIAEIHSDIEFTYFNLQDYQKSLRNANKADDNKLIALFKLLSPEHLLKLPFTNDSNTLDKRFYSELLHIIGLTETKEKSKKLIGRNKEGQRHSGTLLEDAIIQLDSLDMIGQLEKPGQFGNTRQERLFNVALELSITWINRILFLKLLEAQLIRYHHSSRHGGKGESSYAFLNNDRIKSYDDLNSLFFQVLARKQEDRNHDVKQVFDKVPYLNSSLFEPTDIEHATLFISNLRDDKTIPILSSTVLKNEQGKKRTGHLPTLQYLFEFLDAYDFSSEGSEEIQEENKTLINASVLGLIFEKINGYKDGSFFTPGFITMYMSRETIRKAVVQKFNEIKKWNCNNLDELYDRIEDRREANHIVNSLKICDPAVGSGHFLVSALNEIIAVKNDLRILQDRSGLRLKEYHVEVVNDELIVTDEEGELFEYNPNHKESQRIQETLFHEKQTIIENCLFGVDINPNSVKICRLRLWIELLKNAYYIKSDSVMLSSPVCYAESPELRDDFKLPDMEELQTLPNIDINIKCGNSLVSRFALDADLKQALKKSKWTIDSYRLAVDTYRNAQNKEQKREMEKLIADIKLDFRSEISQNDPKAKRLRKLSGELFLLTNQGQLFEMSPKEKATWDKKVASLTADTKKLEAEIEAIKSNKIFENAFEWRFEFPEVLNDEGEFLGFDAILGNPPYIRQEELTEIKPYLAAKYNTYAGTADIYIYFVELGLSILKQNGEFIYILPNKWMRAGYGTKMRDFIKKQNIKRIIDFGDLPVFEEATTYPCILHIQKADGSPYFESALVKTLKFKDTLPDYLKEIKFDVNRKLLQAKGWTLNEVKVQNLLQKLRNTGIPLGEYVNGRMYRGVLTGLNEAFVIDAEMREQLITEDPKSAKIIKPFLAGRDIKRYQKPHSDKFLIFTRRGIEIEKYPAIYKYLETFKERLMPKPKNFKENWSGRKPGNYKWYEIQDAVDYYEEFEKEKIVLPDIAIRSQATIDNQFFYCANTAYIIPDLTEFHLGLLNSKLLLFYYSNLTQTIRGGYFRFIRQYLELLPIISNVKNEESTKLIELIKLKSTEPNNMELEDQIDQLVYELYELTDEEIAIIEGSVT